MEVSLRITHGAHELKNKQTTNLNATLRATFF